MSTFFERITVNKEEKEKESLRRADRKARHESSRVIFSLEENLLDAKDRLEALKNSQHFNFEKAMELELDVKKLADSIIMAKSLREELFPLSGDRFEVTNDDVA
jgi:hypothetical protein